MSIARKLLEIKSLSQTICSITKNETTNTQIKVLYFVDEYSSVSPQVLISKLGIVKSNLALITKNMIKNGLLISKKGFNDKRSIYYSITAKGKKMLDDYISELDKIFHEQDIELEYNMEVILKYLNKKV